MGSNFHRNPATFPSSPKEIIFWVDPPQHILPPPSWSGSSMVKPLAIGSNWNINSISNNSPQWITATKNVQTVNLSVTANSGEYWRASVVELVTTSLSPQQKAYIYIAQEPPEQMPDNLIMNAVTAFNANINGFVPWFNWPPTKYLLIIYEYEAGRVTREVFKSTDYTEEWRGLDKNGYPCKQKTYRWDCWWRWEGDTSDRYEWDFVYLFRTSGS